MTVVEFNYDPRYDVFNILFQKDVHNKGGMLGVKPFDSMPAGLKPVLSIKDADDKQQASIKFVVDWIQKTYKPEDLKASAEAVGRKWKGVEARYFAALAQVTKHQMKPPKVTAYMSHGFPLLRDSQNFSFIVFDKLSSPEKNCAIIAHELFLLHIYSSPIWGKISSQLQKNHCYLLAECLSVVLNGGAFAQAGIPKWTPYPALREIQDLFAKKYAETKDFARLVDFAIEVFKQNFKKAQGGVSGGVQIPLQKKTIDRQGEYSLLSSFAFLDSKVWGIPIWIYFVAFLLVIILLSGR